MRDLVLIFEVWVKSSVKYMPIEVTAQGIPKQFNMADRQEAVETMTEQLVGMRATDNDTDEVYTDIKVLDLIGVYEEGVKLWHEGAE